MKNDGGKAQEAVDIATDIATNFLQQLEARDIDTNTAQAALGNAWFRMCLSIRYTPSTFKNMLGFLERMYEKEFKKNYT